MERTNPRLKSERLEFRHSNALGLKFFLICIHFRSSFKTGMTTGMTDIFDSEKRSWVMSRVRGKNTKPELLIRSLLHGFGYRFTVNGPRNRRLPGKPDIVLPKHRTAVFVHGCFWHGHPGCHHSRIPKSRSEWWRLKIEGNRARDGRNLVAMEELGWNVVVIWTCEFDNRVKTALLAKRLPELIEGRVPWNSSEKVAEERSKYGDGDTME